MKNKKIELISKKAEDEVDYLLFLEKHSDCLNLFNINGFLDSPLKIVKFLHQSRAQTMVYLIHFLTIFILILDFVLGERRNYRNGFKITNKSYLFVPWRNYRIF